MPMSDLGLEGEIWLKLTQEWSLDRAHSSSKPLGNGEANNRGGGEGEGEGEGNDEGSDEGGGKGNAEDNDKGEAEGAPPTKAPKSIPNQQKRPQRKRQDHHHPTHHKPPPKQASPKTQIHEHFRSHGGIYPLADIPEVDEPTSTRVSIKSQTSRGSFETGDTEYFETRSIVCGPHDGSPTTVDDTTTEIVSVGRAVILQPVKAQQLDDGSSMRTTSSASLVADPMCPRLVRGGIDRGRTTPPPVPIVARSSCASSWTSEERDGDWKDGGSAGSVRVRPYWEASTRSLDLEKGGDQAQLVGAKVGKEGQMYEVSKEEDGSYMRWGSNDEGGWTRRDEGRRKKLKRWFRELFSCGSSRDFGVV
ncbi:hypothetical protein P280DRAFT_515557 [Massarina eburnea CBS 473.64]|uniref:Uncharacterized protein n=1 Tax=Massarina eburnea CBS 473.64 TaxID=1395130 RepID=A0A6A6S9K1_9PLEO|nr:hypothetical protein P280DRAFT_515557 [Massarina eburnea CBS 473.64]